MLAMGRLHGVVWRWCVGHAFGVVLGTFVSESEMQTKPFFCGLPTLRPENEAIMKNTQLYLNKTVVKQANTQENYFKDGVCNSVPATPAV